MSEGLSKAEQDFVEFCKRPPVMFHIESKIRLLEGELRRGADITELPPHALAIRAALTADLVEKVERAHIFLGGVLAKLETLQREQVKKL